MLGARPGYNHGRVDRRDVGGDIDTDGGAT